MKELVQAFRAGTAPTWWTVLTAGIYGLVVGVYIGAIIMAVALR